MFLKSLFRKVRGPKTLILLGAFVSSAPLWSSDQKPVPPAPDAELPAGEMHEKATTACTECHEARIILQQRLSKGTWTKEVDKMIKWGAIVDASDRDALIDYLGTNFSPDKPVYAAQRTAPRGKR